MIAVATVLAIRFRVSLSIFDTASDVLENTDARQRVLRRRLAGGAGVLRRLRPRPLRRRHRGVPARRQRVVLHRRAGGVSAFLMKFPLSRGFFVLLFAIGVLLLLLGRLLSRRVIQRLRVRGSSTSGSSCRHPGLHRRDLHRAAPRALARLPRDRLPGAARLRRARSRPRAGIPVLGLTDTVREVVDDLRRRHRLLRRRRRELVDRSCAGSRGTSRTTPRPDHRRAQRHRRLQRAHPHPPRGRAAAHAPGSPAVAGGDQQRQARSSTSLGATGHADPGLARPCWP